MEKQGRFQSMLRFLGAVALMDVGIFVVVILICWLLGWRTASQYGNATFFAGIAVIAVGIMSIVGSFELRGNPIYKYGQSVGMRTLADSTRQDMKEMNRSYRLVYQLATVGLVLIILGALIQTVFR
jgi:FtsH-binding integral membrane protein